MKVTMINGLKKIALWVLLLPIVAWTGLALTYTGAIGGEGLPWRALLGAFVALAMLIALLIWPRRRALWACALVFALTVAFWAWHSPSNSRDWDAVALHSPWAEVKGNKVIFHNVRNFRYRVDGPPQENWYSESYDLRHLTQSHLSLTRFGGVPGMAHAMVSFTFQDPAKGPQYLMLSAEIRREKGEGYHPIGGLFRQFELFYVVADERDALALRTHVHQDPTWLIPMNAGPEKTRAFFLDMVQRVNTLRDAPEWYNSISNSCASNLASHYESINQVNLPPDYRIVLPGFADDLLADLDLLPIGVSPQDALQRYRVDERARQQPVDEHFSTRIRQGLLASGVTTAL